jgi:hypothetical protein
LHYYRGLYIPVLFFPVLFLIAFNLRRKLYIYVLVALSAVAIILFPFYFIGNQRGIALIALIENSVILFTFLKLFFIETVASREFNVFIAVLMMYELSLIIRFFVGATGAEIGIYYYTISLIFETIIGLFFAIFTEESPVLKFKIKNLW